MMAGVGSGKRKAGTDGFGHRARGRELTGVRPEMVDFGFEQGLSDFETAGIVDYFEDFKRAKTPLGAKRCHLWMDTN